MRITEIDIKKYRGIDDANFSLSDKLNVLVGVNGSGKTTVLDAIATSLSWLVNRIQRENTSGRPISESSIKNGAPYSFIGINIVEHNKNYKWKIVKTARGYSSKEKSELTAVSELSQYFQEILREKSTLPVIAYYPINRVVDSVSPKISKKEILNVLDVYDNAIGGKTNYQSFFEWFRLQDDIVNEKAQSRTKWMIQNKAWLKRKIKKLLSYLEEMAKVNDYDNIEVKQFFKRFDKDELIYEEPRFLFHELIDLLHTAEFRFSKNYKFGDVFHDIDYLLHRMSSLSDSRKDNLIESGKFPTSIIRRIVTQIEKIQDRKEITNGHKIIASFIWEALSFAVLLSLWWLSEKGKKEIETLFMEFNPLKYKNNREIEYEYKYEKFVDSLDKVLQHDAERLDKATKSEGRELKHVTKTIERFVPGYSNLRVKRVPRPQMLVDKDGETISLDQLSDGEKNLIALVGDIARRLSIANSNSSRPLDGSGIILIDEIDLHLHPSWQRLMIPQLTKLFPNCQFIITTHSPQVLSHVKPENIFLLSNEKNVFTYSKALESYGMNSDRILEDLLGVDARPTKEKNLLHDLFKLIQDGQIEKAKEATKALTKLIGEDPELVKAEVLIKRKEIIGK